MENSLKKRLPQAAFAFRGYDVTNLGKTPELLQHRAYGATVRRFLDQASQICSDVTKRKVDLAARVERRAESSLRSYPQDLSLIMGAQLAQLKLLEDFFDASIQEAQYAFGYSLGEVTAVVAAGVYEMEAVLSPLLALAKDAARLARDVTMAVVFSRGPALDLHTVRRMCAQITSEGGGVLSVFSYLSPNTVLLMGQGETVDRFKQLIPDFLPKAIHLRKNTHIWPPLHTPITWQRNIPNRGGVMMSAAPGGFTSPKPAILSCVTGDASYNDYNSRDILNRWIDHPQKLWDVVDKILAEGVETVIHVGPEPNIIPATFARLSNNITTQLVGRSLSSLGLRAISHIVRRHRPWLARRLSSDATLLRAPFVDQIILEDWLLEQDVK
jgi:[acyl-carrier-protein] S-malonyltransferase